MAPNTKFVGSVVGLGLWSWWGISGLEIKALLAVERRSRNRRSRKKACVKSWEWGWW